MNPTYEYENFIVLTMQIEYMHTMVLYRYFKPSGTLPDPSGPLSAFASPSVISEGAWHYASTYKNLNAIRSFM